MLSQGDIMKKVLAIIMACITFFLWGCSREEKFGLEQFVTRMNKEYNTTLSTADFLFGEGEENERFFICDGEDFLLSLPYDSEGNISGVAVMVEVPEKITAGIDFFCNSCVIFTDHDEKKQDSILKECGITPEKIKFTDGDSVITVGRYKYTIVSNEYSVTLFCDRI